MHTLEYSALLIGRCEVCVVGGWWKRKESKVGERREERVKSLSLFHPCTRFTTYLEVPCGLLPRVSEEGPRLLPLTLACLNLNL